MKIVSTLTSTAGARTFETTARRSVKPPALPTTRGRTGKACGRMSIRRSPGYAAPEGDAAGML
jgi:hypothetical protein